MNKKKKILAIMLAIILIFNYIPAHVITTYAEKENNEQQEIENPIEKETEKLEAEEIETTEEIIEVSTENSDQEETNSSEKPVEETDIQMKGPEEKETIQNSTDSKEGENKEDSGKQKDDTEIESNKDSDTTYEDDVKNDNKKDKEKDKEKNDKEKTVPTFDRIYDGISVEGLDFSSCELLIATEDPSVFTADTEVISVYNNIYLTRYADKEQTMSAYTYYYSKADFVDVNSVIKASGKNDESVNDESVNDGHGEADLSDVNSGDDAISIINSVEPEDYSGCVALIDTGASGAGIVNAVSVIGETVTDDNGHGSLMAQAMISANPDIKILSIKALDEAATGSVSDVYAAIEYAIKARVSVINLSMCSVASLDSDVLKKAIEEALEKDIVVVASAGNNGRNASYYVPAGIAGVITVGACDDKGIRLEKSNYGSSVDYYVVADSTSDAASKLSAYAIRDGIENVSKRKDVYNIDEMNKESKAGGNEKTDKHFPLTQKMLDDILLRATATPPEGSGFPHYINDVTVEIYQTSAAGKSFTGYMVSANVPKTSRYYNKLKIGTVECYCAKHPDREGGCADPGPGKHTISGLKFTYVSSSKGVATYTAISNVDGQTHENGYQRMELTIKLNQQNSFISIQKLLAGNPKNKLKDVYFDIYDNKNASGKPLGYMKTSSTGGVAHNVYEDTDFKTMTHSTSDGLKGSLDLAPETTVYLFEVGQGSSYSNAKNKVPSDSKYKTDAAHDAGQPNVTKYAIDLLPDNSKYIASYAVKTTSTKGGEEETLTNPVEEFVFIYKKDEYGFEPGAQYQIYGTTKELVFPNQDRTSMLDIIKKAKDSKLVTTISVKDGYGVGDVSSYKREHLDSSRYYYAVEVENTTDTVHKPSLPFSVSSRTYKPDKGDYGYSINTDIEEHYYYKVGVYKYDDKGRTVKAVFDIYSTEKSGAVSGGSRLGTITTNGDTGYGVYDVTKDYIKSVMDGKPHYYYAVETSTDNEHEIQAPKEVSLKLIKGNTADFTLNTADYVKKLNPVIKPVKPEIKTSATVLETDSKMLAQSGCDEIIDYKNQTIRDTISYQNLRNNTTYTFLTELMIVNNDGEVTAYMKDGKALRQVSTLRTDDGKSKTTYNVKGMHAVDIRGVDPTGLEEEQKKLVVYETLYLGEYKDLSEIDRAVADRTVKRSYDGYTDLTYFPVEHKDKNDTFQTVRPIDIHTAASYSENLDRISYPIENAVITDKVFYTGLEVGKEYTIRGTLFIKPENDGETEIELKDKDGNIVEVEHTFTAPANEGCEEIVFEFDASLMKGKTVVAFEDLIYNDLKIAVHRDIRDENESIHFPEFKTTTRNAAVSDIDDVSSKEIYTSKDASIIDKISYHNLLANRSYRVKGILMDKETGEVMKDADGKEIKGETIVNTKEVSESLDKVSPNAVDYKLSDGTVLSLSADHANYSCDGYTEVIYDGYDLTNLAGKTGVVYEEIYLIQDGSEYLVGEHKDIEDVEQFVYFADIHTCARDKSTGIKTVPCDSDTSILDEVTYKNLIPGKEYTLKASLHVKNDKSGKYKNGEYLKDKSGKDLIVESSFIPEEKDGTAVVEIPLNTSELRSMELVVYEEMYNSLGTLVAEHKDMEDSEQTVTVPGGYTNAVEKSSNTQTAGFDKLITVVDKITYENFEPGKTYKVTGTMYSKQTKNPIKSGDNLMTSTVEFVPENSNGTVEVPFTFSTKYLSGAALVAFEEVTYTNEAGIDITVFKHQDINSKEQTIQIEEGNVDKKKPPKAKAEVVKKVVKEKKNTVSKSPKTGDALPFIPIVLLLVLSLSGIVLIARKKKHRNNRNII